MAENLLRYGFQRKGYRTVEDILNEAENLVRSAPTNEMREFLEELEDIKEKVFHKELEFYQSFGVTNYEQFNSKIKEIENAYKPLLTNGAAIWAIRKVIDFANISTSSSPEEVQAALNEVLEEFLSTDGRQDS